MKVLFATTNPAKIKKYVKELEINNIEILTINDLDIKLEVEEKGKDAIENAYIKAKAYYDATKMITIGIDNNLFIEELPAEKQPGNYVRRINGKELSDEEMIEHYTNLVKENGGRLTAKWVYGMVIYNGIEAKAYTWNKSKFYFVDKPHEKRNPGYPLDSISILPEVNKYFVELTETEKKNMYNEMNENGDVKFLIENIIKG